MFLSGGKSQGWEGGGRSDIVSHGFPQPWWWGVVVEVGPVVVTMLPSSSSSASHLTSLLVSRSRSVQP